MNDELKNTDIETAKKEAVMPLKKRILPGIGLPAWALSGFLAAAFLIGIVIGLLAEMGVLNADSVDGSVFNTVISALVYLLALALVVGLPYKILGYKTTKEELGLTRLPNWKDIWLAPLGYIAHIILAGIVVTLASQLIAGFDPDQAQETGFEGISQSYEYILAFITLVIIAPVAEEVLMRGYLYGKMRAVTGVVVATIVSSLLFSVMHLQWNVALTVLPLGIVMVALREMTGSIWAGVLLHMLNNGIAYYLLFVNPSLLDTMGV